MRKQRNTNPLPPLQPEGSGTPTEIERLRRENARLDHKCHAQAHALAQLNKAIRFAFEKLNQPLMPYGTTRPARRGKL